MKFVKKLSRYVYWIFEQSLNAFDKTLFLINVFNDSIRHANRDINCDAFVVVRENAASVLTVNQL